MNNHIKQINDQYLNINTKLIDHTNSIQLRKSSMMNGKFAFQSLFHKAMNIGEMSLKPYVKRSSLSSIILYLYISE